MALTVLFSIPASAAGVAVSVDREGQPVAAAHPSLSNDGRFVAFTSASPDIVRDDTNHLTNAGRGQDVFVRDRRRCVTTRVSVSSEGAEADEDSTWPVISANGRYVAFLSKASNLIAGDVGDERRNVFLHDRRRGRTELIDVRIDGAPARGVDFVAPVAVSRTGRLVAFSSDASGLVAEATPQDADQIDVYVRDRKRGITQRVSVTEEGDAAGGVLRAMSADGRWIVFGSAGRLAQGDVDDEWDLHLTIIASGRTRRINVVEGADVRPWRAGTASVSDDGCIVAFGLSERPGIAVYDCRRGSTQIEIGVGDAQPPALSGDGRHVGFRAHAGDIGPLAGVYAFDRHTRTFELLVRLDSSLPPFLDLSRDGGVLAVASSLSRECRSSAAALECPPHASCRRRDLVQRLADSIDDGGFSSRHQR